MLFFFESAKPFDMFDFNKLKELARQTGGILILNGSEPELVLLPYDTYERLIGTKQTVVPPGSETKRTSVDSSAPDGTEAKLRQQQQEDDKLIETLNREIAALREKMAHSDTPADVVEEII